MFNIKDQIFVVEIPKNGSRSLLMSVRQKYGKNAIKIEGHRTAAEMLALKDTLVSEKNRPLPPYTIAAVIRNPAERLFSQVRQLERHRTKASLDNIMERAWEQSDIVMKPQWQFVEVPTDEDIDLRLWDMKRIDLAQRFVSQSRQCNIWQNRRPPNSNITDDQIISHKLFVELLESPDHFGPDMQLWVRSQRTNEDGQDE
jgi:hypothetical protein